MKKTIYTQLIILLLVLTGQNTFAQWQKVIMNDSVPESRPASFVIGDTAYMGNGDTGFFVYSDAWRGYTQSGNTWGHVRQYPGGGGDWGFRFVIGDTAYIGDGADPGWENDMYFYTPTTGWINVPTGGPGGIYRGYMAGFSINHKGYAGCGTNGTNFNDFWEFDPSSGSWTQVANFPGGGRLGTTSFSARGYGYVGLGGDNSGKTYRDMYRYDPGTNTWDTMLPMPSDTGMEEPGYFVLCGKLIVTCGDTIQSGTHTTKQAWLFDPTIAPKGKWTRLGDFAGPLPAYAPGGFAMGDTGFIYGGYDYGPPGSGVSNIYWAHMYRFVATALLMEMTITPADTTICAGSPVILNGSGATSYLWSTTDTTFSINVAPQKDTSFIVTEYNGACVFNDTAVIHVTAAPNLTITPDPALICGGQTLTLTAKGATTYQWVGTTDTTDTLNVTPTKDTTYELLAGNGSCIEDTLIPVKTGGTLNMNVLPQSPTICAGSSITLIASGASVGSTYNWTPSTGLNNSTGDSVIATPSASVTYTLTATDTLGCSGSAVDTITVVPVPNVPTISQSGDTLKSSAATDNQWYLNGTEINGATGQYLIIGSATETYTVAVVNPADGCTSNSAAYVTSGINQLTINSNQLSIFPNPTNGTITVTINSSVNDISDWNLRLTDVLGRTIYTRNSLSYSNEIDLSNLAGGVYFITVTDKAEKGVFKVMKQ